MKFQTIFIIVSVSFLFLSCKKEKENNVFFVNKSYQTGNTASVEPVRLFTRNGELTDTVLIKKFILANVLSINPFNFGSTVEQIPYTKLRISFTENNNAIVERYDISHPSTPGTIKSHTATYDFASGSDLKIQERDTITIIEADQGRCADLFENSFLNPPVKQCIPSGPFHFLCKFVNSFSLKSKNETLSLPLLIVLVKSTDIPGGTGGCISYNFADRWYSPNLNHISTLGPQDTVAFQAKELPLFKL